MKSSLQNPPDGYHSVTPSITIRGAAKAIEFYKQAFQATEAMRMDTPGGHVMHAELLIGDSRVMLSDEFPDWGALSPQSIGGSASSLMIYVDDVDAAIEQAQAAGATVLHPTMDQFWGDRSGTINDPFGHRWTLASHIEDIGEEEIKARAAAMFDGSGEKCG